MQNTSETLLLFTEETLQTLTLSLSARLASISQWLEKERGLKETKVALSSTQLPSWLGSDQVFLSGKMLKEHSPQTLAQTFGRLSKRLPTLGIIDLNGNCLTQAGYSPKIESEYTLSDILQDEVSQEYFLSKKMISHLLRKKKYQFRPKLSGTLKANGNMNTDDTYIIPRKAKALTGGGNSGGLHSDMTIIQINPSKESGGKQPYQQNRVFDEKGISPALTKHNSDFIIKQHSRGKNKGADLTICPTISSNAFQENNLLDGIRRLTEIECERLQGFSDNWTQYGNYKNTIKRISRTRRYKLIGNAVTVDIVELIAKRLKIIEQ